jgi:phosphoenolpyruvate carboxylase
MAMEKMSQSAYECYRRLVHHTPGFHTFWRHATPIDLLSELHIGSRPVSRKPGRNVLDHIRAIPWVFSWMQSRFNLPGWYGFGFALGQAGIDLPLLRDMFSGWPFFQTLIDNTEMSLSKADMEIASLYVDLVPDPALGKRIYRIILDEFERTQEMVLKVSGHQQLLDADPVIQRSVILRNPYIDPLNYLQLEALRRLRSLKHQDSEQARELKEVILVTINGIAAGLRNTG